MEWKPAHSQRGHWTGYARQQWTYVDSCERTTRILRLRNEEILCGKYCRENSKKEASSEERFPVHPRAAEGRGEDVGDAGSRSWMAGGGFGPDDWMGRERL